MKALVEYPVREGSVTFNIFLYVVELKSFILSPCLWYHAVDYIMLVVYSNVQAVDVTLGTILQ